MIRNWDFHRLNIDFSSLDAEGITVSDIDGYHLGDNNMLAILEVKNESGELHTGQRMLLERIVDGWVHRGVVIFAKHDKYVQHNDNNVDLGDCNVVSIYYNRRGWKTPRKPTKVKEVMEYFFREEVTR